MMRNHTGVMEYQAAMVYRVNSLSLTSVLSGG
jgi:hypothetical protein